jgi:MFS family permease
MGKYGRYGTARQREEYGGINWGASFFGWLVAVGIGALLTAVLSAAGTAIALSELESPAEAAANADTVGIVGGILILATMLLAYFAGGYVAGRMSRFDGGRQGIGVWIWSIVVVLLLAVLGAIAGSEWNLFAGLDLPRIPVDEGDVTVGGVILLLIVLVGTLLAAMAGGKAGERYHRRVDDLGHVPAGDRARDRDTVTEEAREERAERRAEQRDAREPRDTRPVHS